MDPVQEATSESTPLQNGHLLTRQNVLALVLLSATAIVFFLCYAMLRPFLSALVWALAFAVMAHPLHAWIEKRVTRPNVAAAISVILVTLILIVPTAFVVHQLVVEAAAHIEYVQSPEAAAKWRETLESTSIGQNFLWLDSELKITEQVGDLRQELAKRTGEVLRDSVWTVVNVLITMFTLFFMFRDRRWALQSLASLVPLSLPESAQVFKRVEDTIYATVYGSVTMAMIQGALGGFMFWWLGLPAPVLWGVVMALLATVPNLGAFIVWAPTAAGLALQGETQSAIILAVWGLTAIALIDNLLYPFMVGQRLRMHSALVFFAVLGGLMVFGIAGLIVGPVIFAIADALMDIWRRRTSHGQAAECAVTSAPVIVVPGETNAPAGSAKELITSS